MSQSLQHVQCTRASNIRHICMRANSKLFVLRSIRYLSRSVLDILYKQQVRSVIDYGLIIFYGTLNQVDIEKLNKIQYQSAKVVTGALHFSSRIKLEQDLGWESLSARNEFLGLSMFYKIAHNSVRPLIRTFLPKPVVKTYNTRSKDEYVNFLRPNEKFYKSFFPHFTRSWNNLNLEDQFSMLTASALASLTQICVIVVSKRLCLISSSVPFIKNNSK